MPRAIWSGAISFGLVNIPVKLYSAVSRKTVRFNQLDGRDGTRIQQKRVNPQTGEEVPYERLVKGYEISPERYVVVEPQELEAIEPRKTHMIEIEDFVELDEIDPIYYDHPYYLAPGKGAAKAYALLLAAMEDSGKVGIARVVIRSKEQLVALRARDGIIHLETMLFGDEVVPPDSLDEIPDAAELEANAREVKMAGELIASLTSEFDPAKYRDTYRDQVLDLIERKAEGEEIAVQPQEEERPEVPDLMSALEASIAASKRQGGAERKRKPARKRAAASKDGSKAKAGGAKKPAAKRDSTSTRKPAAKRGSTAKRKPASRK
ncbi:MAG: Ku protein [Solirubrobacterales bacterium]|nr:Ku protein [Solirubrobacterales bacterium]